MTHDTDSWTAAATLLSRFTPAWSAHLQLRNTAFVGTGTYFTSSLADTDSFKKYWGVPNIALGISNKEPIERVLIYPNPANDHITIQGSMETGTTISINDLQQVES